MTAYHLEDGVDVFAGGVSCDDWLGVAAHQVVDAAHHVKQLITRDHPVTVRVVQAERPQQLLLHRAASQHRQTSHELLHIRSIRYATSRYAPVQLPSTAPRASTDRPVTNS